MLEESFFTAWWERAGQRERGGRRGSAGGGPSQLSRTGVGMRGSMGCDVAAAATTPGAGTALMSSSESIIAPTLGEFRACWSEGRVDRSDIIVVIVASCRR
jgi:hypothetical protein